MSVAVSPLILQRYELKYLIPLELVEPISQYAEMYCDMDYYSKIEPDHFYLINSLYFDSDDFAIFNYKQQKRMDSLNLRVRSYGSNPVPPYFFEIKKKYNKIVKKNRAKVYCDNIEKFIDELKNGDQQSLSAETQKTLDEFFYWQYSFQATPKVLTQYRRKAYISNVDDYARVTFDKNLRYYPEESWSVHPVDHKMTNYDNALLFDCPESMVILELKATTRVPYWIIDLVRYFGLSQDSISKFQSAMLHEFSNEEISHGSRIFQMHR